MKTLPRLDTLFPGSVGIELGNGGPLFRCSCLGKLGLGGLAFSTGPIRCKCTPYPDNGGKQSTITGWGKMIPP